MPSQQLCSPSQLLYSSSERSEIATVLLLQDLFQNLLENFNDQSIINDIVNFFKLRLDKWCWSKTESYVWVNIFDLFAQVLLKYFNKDYILYDGNSALKLTLLDLELIMEILRVSEIILTQTQGYHFPYKLLHVLVDYLYYLSADFDKWSNVFNLTIESSNNGFSCTSMNTPLYIIYLTVFVFKILISYRKSTLFASDMTLLDQNVKIGENVTSEDNNSVSIGEHNSGNIEENNTGNVEENSSVNIEENHTGDIEIKNNIDNSEKPPQLSYVKFLHSLSLLTTGFEEFSPEYTDMRGLIFHSFKSKKIEHLQSSLTEAYVLKMEKDLQNRENILLYLLIRIMCVDISIHLKPANFLNAYLQTYTNFLGASVILLEEYTMSIFKPYSDLVMEHGFKDNRINPINLLFKDILPSVFIEDVYCGLHVELIIAITDMFCAIFQESLGRASQLITQLRATNSNGILVKVCEIFLNVSVQLPDDANVFENSHCSCLLHTDYNSQLVEMWTTERMYIASLGLVAAAMNHTEHTCLSPLYDNITRLSKLNIEMEEISFNSYLKQIVGGTTACRCFEVIIDMGYQTHQFALFSDLTLAENLLSSTTTIAIKYVEDYVDYIINIINNDTNMEDNYSVYDSLNETLPKYTEFSIISSYIESVIELIKTNIRLASAHGHEDSRISFNKLLTTPETGVCALTYRLVCLFLKIAKVKPTWSYEIILTDISHSILKLVGNLLEFINLVAHDDPAVIPDACSASQFHFLIRVMEEEILPLFFNSTYIHWFLKTFDQQFSKDTHFSKMNLLVTLGNYLSEDLVPWWSNCLSTFVLHRGTRHWLSNSPHEDLTEYFKQNVVTTHPILSLMRIMVFRVTEDVNFKNLKYNRPCIINQAVLSVLKESENDIVSDGSLSINMMIFNDICSELQRRYNQFVLKLGPSSPKAYDFLSDICSFLLPVLSNQKYLAPFIKQNGFKHLFALLIGLNGAHHVPIIYLTINNAFIRALVPPTGDRSMENPIQNACASLTDTLATSSITDRASHFESLSHYALGTTNVPSTLRSQLFDRSGPSFTSIFLFSPPSSCHVVTIIKNLNQICSPANAKNSENCQLKYQSDFFSVLQDIFTIYEDRFSKLLNQTNQITYDSDDDSQPELSRSLLKNVILNSFEQTSSLQEIQYDLMISILNLLFLTIGTVRDSNVLSFSQSVCQRVSMVLKKVSNVQISHISNFEDMKIEKMNFWDFIKLSDSQNTFQFPELYRRYFSCRTNIIDKNLRLTKYIYDEFCMSRDNLRIEPPTNTCSATTSCDAILDDSASAVNSAGPNSSSFGIQNIGLYAQDFIEERYYGMDESNNNICLLPISSMLIYYYYFTFIPAVSKGTNLPHTNIKPPKTEMTDFKKFNIYTIYHKECLEINNILTNISTCDSLFPPDIYINFIYRVLFSSKSRSRFQSIFELNNASVCQNGIRPILLNNLIKTGFFETIFYSKISSLLSEIDPSFCGIEGIADLFDGFQRLELLMGRTTGIEFLEMNSIKHFEDNIKSQNSTAIENFFFDGKVALFYLSFLFSKILTNLPIFKIIPMQVGKIINQFSLIETSSSIKFIENSIEIIMSKITSWISSWITPIHNAIVYIRHANSTLLNQTRIKLEKNYKISNTSTIPPETIFNILSLYMSYPNDRLWYYLINNDQTDELKHYTNFFSQIESINIANQFTKFLSEISNTLLYLKDVKIDKINLKIDKGISEFLETNKILFKNQLRNTPSFHKDFNSSKYIHNILFENIEEFRDFHEEILMYKKFEISRLLRLYYTCKLYNMINGENMVVNFQEINPKPTIVLFLSNLTLCYEKGDFKVEEFPKILKREKFYNFLQNLKNSTFFNYVRVSFELAMENQKNEVNDIYGFYLELLIHSDSHMKEEEESDSIKDLKSINLKIPYSIGNYLDDFINFILKYSMRSLESENFWKILFLNKKLENIDGILRVIDSVYHSGLELDQNIHILISSLLSSILKSKSRNPHVKLLSFFFKATSIFSNEEYIDIHGEYNEASPGPVMKWTTFQNAFRHDFYDNPLIAKKFFDGEYAHLFTVFVLSDEIFIKLNVDSDFYQIVSDISKNIQFPNFQNTIYNILQKMNIDNTTIFLSLWETCLSSQKPIYLETDFSILSKSIDMFKNLNNDKNINENNDKNIIDNFILNLNKIDLYNRGFSSIILDMYCEKGEGFPEKLKKLFIGLKGDDMVIYAWSIIFILNDYVNDYLIPILTSINTIRSTLTIVYKINKSIESIDQSQAIKDLQKTTNSALYCGLINLYERLKKLVMINPKLTLNKYILDKKESILSTFSREMDDPKKDLIKTEVFLLLSSIFYDQRFIDIMSLTDVVLSEYMAIIGKTDDFFKIVEKTNLAFSKTSLIQVSMNEILDRYNMLYQSSDRQKEEEEEHVNPSDPIVHLYNRSENHDISEEEEGDNQSTNSDEDSIDSENSDDEDDDSDDVIEEYEGGYNGDHDYSEINDIYTDFTANHLEQMATDEEIANENFISEVHPSESQPTNFERETEEALDHLDRVRHERERYLADVMEDEEEEEEDEENRTDSDESTDESSDESNESLTELNIDEESISDTSSVMDSSGEISSEEDDSLDIYLEGDDENSTSPINGEEEDYTCPPCDPNALVNLKEEYLTTIFLNNITMNNLLNIVSVFNGIVWIIYDLIIEDHEMEGEDDVIATISNFEKVIESSPWVNYLHFYFKILNNEKLMETAYNIDGMRLSGEFEKKYFIKFRESRIFSSVESSVNQEGSLLFETNFEKKLIARDLSIINPNRVKNDALSLVQFKPIFVDFWQTKFLKKKEHRTSEDRPTRIAPMRDLYSMLDSNNLLDSIARSINGPITTTTVFQSGRRPRSVTRTTTSSSRPHRPIFDFFGPMVDESHKVEIESDNSVEEKEEHKYCCLFSHKDSYFEKEYYHGNLFQRKLKKTILPQGNLGCRHMFDDEDGPEICKDSICLSCRVNYIGNFNMESLPVYTIKEIAKEETLPLNVTPESSVREEGIIIPPSTPEPSIDMSDEEETHNHEEGAHGNDEGGHDQEEGDHGAITQESTPQTPQEFPRSSSRPPGHLSELTTAQRACRGYAPLTVDYLLYHCGIDYSFFPELPLEYQREAVDEFISDLIIEASSSTTSRLSQLRRQYIRDEVVLLNERIDNILMDMDRLINPIEIESETILNDNLIHPADNVTNEDSNSNEQVITDDPRLSEARRIISEFDQISTRISIFREHAIAFSEHRASFNDSQIEEMNRRIVDIRSIVTDLSSAETNQTTPEVVEENTQTTAVADNTQNVIESADFIATLDTDLRTEVLLTADNAFILSLPMDLQEEAQTIRRRQRFTDNMDFFTITDLTAGGNNTLIQSTNRLLNSSINNTRNNNNFLPDLEDGQQIDSENHTNTPIQRATIDMTGMDQLADFIRNTIDNPDYEEIQREIINNTSGPPPSIYGNTEDCDKIHIRDSWFDVDLTNFSNFLNLKENPKNLLEILHLYMEYRVEIDKSDFQRRIGQIKTNLLNDQLEEYNLFNLIINRLSENQNISTIFNENSQNPILLLNREYLLTSRLKNQLAPSFQKIMELRKLDKLPSSFLSIISTKTCVHRFPQSIQIQEVNNIVNYPKYFEYFLKLLFSSNIPNFRLSFDSVLHSLFNYSHIDKRQNTIADKLLNGFLFFLLNEISSLLNTTGNNGFIIKDSWSTLLSNHNQINSKINLTTLSNEKSIAYSTSICLGRLLSVFSTFLGSRPIGGGKSGSSDSENTNVLVPPGLSESVVNWFFTNESEIQISRKKQRSLSTGVDTGVTPLNKKRRGNDGREHPGSKRSVNDQTSPKETNMSKMLNFLTTPLFSNSPPHSLYLITIVHSVFIKYLEQFAKKLTNSPNDGDKVSQTVIDQLNDTLIKNSGFEILTNLLYENLSITTPERIKSREKILDIFTNIIEKTSKIPQNIELSERMRKSLFSRTSVLLNEIISRDNNNNHFLLFTELRSASIALIKLNFFNSWVKSNLDKLYQIFDDILEPVLSRYRNNSIFKHQCSAAQRLLEEMTSKEQETTKKTTTKTANQNPTEKEERTNTTGVNIPAELMDMIALVEVFFLTMEVVKDEDDKRFLNFCEGNKTVLNAYIKTNHSLLMKEFTLIISKKLFNCLDFDNKRSYFRQKMHSELPTSTLRVTSIYPGGTIRLNLRRTDVFIDTFHQLRYKSGMELKGAKLSIHFVGEEGVDAGGVLREWYTLLSREIFNPNYALFTTNNQSTFMINPNSVINPDHLQFFEFCGRIVGKALFDGHRLRMFFTRHFYKQILGHINPLVSQLSEMESNLTIEEINSKYLLNSSLNQSLLHEMENVDSDFYKNLKYIIDTNVSELGDTLDLVNFTVEENVFGQISQINLIPKGDQILLTDENKNAFVNFLCVYKLYSAVQPQMTSFLKGFYDVIPKETIAMFSERELEFLISGLPKIDLTDLKANTDYVNYHKNSDQILWFWDLLFSFTDEELANFLQFATGSSQVPLEGFKGLLGMRGPQKFSIHRLPGNTDLLPSAHTCYNQLDLPEYETREKLFSKLKLAIEEAHEGFGFV